MMPMASVRNFWAALRAVRQTQPELIHATFDSHAIVWVLVARLCAVPIVIAYHTVRNFD